jgi:hypothetical protein
VSDDIFDPEIHATDKEGNPSTNKDGSFRKKRRDAGAARGITSRTTKSNGGGQQHGRYREGVEGLLQIPAMALSFVSPVDGFSVAHHTPPISKAVADLAIERPEVAAALDKVLAVGPYGALIGAVLPLVVQLAHNHDMVPAPMAKAMGATPKKDIERHLKLASARSTEEREADDTADWQERHAEAA